jgi:TetR/AcrR family transcriptional repressor of nem operon
MRVTKERLQAHREGIVAAAGRLFRARGVDGVAVAEIMNAAGLTHGGFYGHYGSKAALAADACKKSLTDGAEKWRRRAMRARDAGEAPLPAIIGDYLSESHVARPQDGCALPTLSADAWRAGPPLDTAMAEGVAGLLAVLEEEAPPGTADARRAAQAALSAMVGGVVVARACTEPDTARDVLDAARMLALQAFQTD